MPGRAHYTALLVALLSLACPVRSIAASRSAADGDWIGGFMFRGEWVTVGIHFESDSSAFRGIASVAFTDYEGERGITLTGLTTEASHTKFTIPTNRGSVVVEARQSTGTINGRFHFAGASGAFGLIRTVPLSTEDRAALFGVYELGPGHYASVFDFYGENVRFVDYETGQQNTLYRVSEDSFVSGPGQTMSYPVAHTFQFIKDGNGRVGELRWLSTGGDTRVARRVPLTETPLTCTRDTVTLAGTLIVPATPGPHPTIIITPGDYGSPRDALKGYAFNFVRRGIAALVFDSRGAGGSSGPLGVNSFSDLAEDVLTWVAFLRQRRELDPKKIGLFGFSNSSYIVTLAASRSKDVAFLLSHSTSALAPWRQERYRVERQVRLAGFSADEVKKAVGVMDLKFDVGRTGEGWDQLQKLLEQYSNERWLPYTNPPRSLERLRNYWARNYSYEPRTALERLTCPTLFLFGSVDSNMPVDASIPVIREAMKRAGNKTYMIKVFPRGRHDLIEGIDGGPREFPRMKHFVPGYWDFMADWVVEQTG